MRRFGLRKFFHGSGARSMAIPIMLPRASSVARESAGPAMPNASVVRVPRCKGVSDMPRLGSITGSPRELTICKSYSGNQVAFGSVRHTVANSTDKLPPPLALPRTLVRRKRNHLINSSPCSEVVNSSCCPCFKSYILGCSTHRCVFKRK